MLGTVASGLAVGGLGLIEIWRKATPVIAKEQYGDPIPVNDLDVWWIAVPYQFNGIAQACIFVGFAQFVRFSFLFHFFSPLFRIPPFFFFLFSSFLCFHFLVSIFFSIPVFPSFLDSSSFYFCPISTLSLVL